MNKRPYGRTAPRKQDEKQENDDRGLPAALDVERTALGSCFLDEMAYSSLVAAGLKLDYFSLTSHRMIFRAIQGLSAANVPIEAISVMNELDKRKETASIGGAAYLASLVDGIPDYSGALQRDQIKNYVAILREKFWRRKVFVLGNKAQACAIDLSDSIEFVVSGIQEDLLKMQGDTSREGYEIKEFSSVVLAEIKEQMYSTRETIGLPFGIDELDLMTTGMRDGELIIVGGYPGSGKTAFALDVARKAALNQYPVAIFSVEMTKEQVLHRLWAQHSDISYRSLRNPKDLTRQDFRELENRWMGEVDKLPLKIDDEATNIAEIITRSHLYVKRGAKLIVVDFLQIVDAPGDKEYDRVTYAVDALMSFAKRTGVPVLCLSQLSRPDDRKNAANVVPNMTQLRSSGKIEQNAHLILFTHRPEEDGNPTGEDLIVIAKQRAGVKVRIKASFDGRVQRWDERGKVAPDPQGALELDKTEKKSRKRKAEPPPDKPDEYTAEPEGETP
ncbi:MAG: replicative DNA helicase [Mycobacteriales bacterium]